MLLGDSEIAAEDVEVITGSERIASAAVVVGSSAASDDASTSFFLTISSNWTVVASSTDDAVDEGIRTWAGVVKISSASSTFPVLDS